MKSMIHIIKISCGLLSVGFTMQVNGDVPRKSPLTRYTGLWTNSPFTSKPPQPTATTIENPIEDYTLTGIAPIPGGYRITIVNKDDPDDKHVVEPGGSGEFKVVSVNRNPEVSLGTTVVLSTGSIQGTVSFEPELITLKKAPVAPPEKTAQQLPPGVTPAQANQIQAQRQPRPRIVAPPTPAKNPQGGPSRKNPGNDQTRQPRRRK